MPRTSVQAPTSITHFGALLKYLRRRARITQRELAIEVGYSEVHLSRLEGSYRPPDEQTLLALFVPALDLHDAPELVTRLLELAAAGRTQPAGGDATPTHHNIAVEALAALEAIPLPPTGEVERSDTFQRLCQRLANERVVAVCAMPGVGKTTLVASVARAEAEQCPVFWLTLTAGVTATVGAVVRQLALFLLAHGQTQVLPILPRENTASAQLTLNEQIALLSAALTRLAWVQISNQATQARHLPLLCFDNVHLVQDDPAIMQVLRHLAAATPSALLLISRDHVPILGITTMPLGGMERAEGRLLIARLSNLASPLAERLLDKTAGNPLLLRLALGMLDQFVDHTEIIAHLEQAPEIADLLDATVRQLSAPAANLLALVAVFRQPIDLCNPALRELLQPTDGIPDLALARIELQRRRLLEHLAQASLHPLLRDHVYAGLAADRQRKQRLHEIAARWSANLTDDLVEAAHHYAAAGDIDQAGELLTEAHHAISQQGRAFAAVEVIDVLLAQVRQHSGSSDATRQLLALRADLLVGTRRAAEAESNYRAALQLTLPPTLRAPLAARLAESLVQRGQAEEAIAVCVSARAPLNASHPLLLAQLFTAEGRAHIMCSDYDTALYSAEQALMRIAPLESAAPQVTAEVRAHAYRITATVSRYRQQFEAAAIQLQQVLTAARQGNLHHLAHRCQSDRVMVYFALGDLESAIAVSRDTVPQLQAAHDSYGVARLLSITSLSYLMHGELATALDVVEQASEIAEDIGDMHGLADSQLRRARILIAHGRIAEAHMLIERLFATTTASGDVAIHGYVLDRLAMVQLLRGDPNTAIATFRRALALPAKTADGKLHADVQNHLALALLVLGDDVAAARALAERSPLRLPTSTMLTHHLIEAMLMLARGDDSQTVATAVKAITAEADTTTHYLFSRAAHRLLAAVNQPPPRNAFPYLHWVEAHEHTLVSN